MATTGHESEAINIQGLKSALQKLKTNHIDGKADKATTLAGYGIQDAYTRQEVNGLVDSPHQHYVTVPTYADLANIASPSDDTIYRVSSYDGSRSQVDDTAYSEYAWNGTQYVFLCTKSQIDEVFDVSVYNNNATYADLAAALGNGGANVPQEIRRGGMSVKYVRTGDNRYVLCVLMSKEWSLDTGNWLCTDYLDEEVGATKYTDIPFDEASKYIKKASDKGDIATHASFSGTKLIPVSEGDRFYYTGQTGSVALGVAGYEYDGSTYTYKVTLVLNGGASLVSNKFIIIPAGVTHVMACTQTTVLSSSSFRKVVKSTFGRLKDDLGTTSSIVYYGDSAYTAGHYVNSSGQWVAGNSTKTLFVDVTPGDYIELYDTTGVNNVCTFAKRLSDTQFKPLYQLDAYVSYEKASYKVTEEMTLCISVRSQDDAPRMTLVRNDVDSNIGTLKEVQEDIVEYDEWLEEYDISLGVMFENIAVIGDSMSRGTLASSGSTASTNSFGASYLSCLAKRWNCKSLYHYAKSGTGTYNWLNDAQYGIGKLLADANNGKIYNAYFIAYGHNDAGDTTHIPTVGDATDTAATVDTSGATPSCASGNSFCAYYKAIIDNIRAVAPHAMIFCLSEYDNVIKGRTAYRQAIIDIADWYYSEGDKLVHHLETGGVPIPGMELGTHFSTVGYAYIAKRIDNEVNRVVYNHREDEEIKFFGSYNTDRDANSPWETTQE